MRIRILPILAATILVAASTTTAQKRGAKVGDYHPDYTLPSLANGKPVSLSSFRGKKILLIEFASW